MTQFQEGDAVWLMIDGVWQRGEVRTADEEHVQVRVSFGTEWRGARYLAAESALGFAAEAVAKARDAVVDAAKRQRASWESLPPPAPDYDDRVNETEEAVRLLLMAERVEAEARAKLEALR